MYFYLESAEEAVRAKQPKNKALDVYSAEEYLSDNLLEHYSLIKEVADAIHSSKLYVTDDKTIFNILEEEENQAILFWIVDENGDDAIHCACNHSIPLIMFSPIYEQEKLFEEAKNRGFEVVYERPDWASDDDDVPEFAMERNIVGFENYDIIY